MSKIVYVEHPVSPEEVKAIRAENPNARIIDARFKPKTENIEQPKKAQQKKTDK